MLYIVDNIKQYWQNLKLTLPSVGRVFNNTQKVKVLSLPETIKEKSMFRVKTLRRELVRRAFEGPSLDEGAFTRNDDFSFIVSGSERTFTFRVILAAKYCSIPFSPTLQEVAHSLLCIPLRTNPRLRKRWRHVHFP